MEAVSFNIQAFELVHARIDYKSIAGVWARLFITLSGGGPS
jgi:hypothetical protein